MPDKKYQVFVSSTFADLHEERQKVIETLWMADCIPAGMEVFVATDDEQFAVIKSVIDLCDYYVLIIAKRYGSVNQATGLSYTEMEYDYALSKQIPVLVFALDDHANWPGDRADIEPEQIAKLQVFKQKAMKNRLASVWKDTTDLNRSVALSIMNAKKTYNRPGWQRAVDFDEVSLRREIMDLNEQNKVLLQQVNQLKQELDAYAAPNDELAFSDTPMVIPYQYSVSDGYLNVTYIQQKITSSLIELFEIISMEMLEQPVYESTVERAIIRRLGNGTNGNINDEQFVKRCLNQFRALGLVQVVGGEEEMRPRWKLTPKGEKKRDDMTLIKKTNT